jgi:hypothetical protein
MIPRVSSLPKKETSNSLNRIIWATIPLSPMMRSEIFKEWVLMDSLIINISPPFVKGG